MEPCPPRRHMPASDILTSDNPPMSPDSSGELSPFDLSGDIGDLCSSYSIDDGLEGNQQDGSAGQKWDNHTEIAEQAKHEAEIENRIAELRKEGFWTPRRLSKFPEPTRPKVLWDYLCEEMQWLAADFGQERRWKRGVARKVVRMVCRHHEELKQKEERARREEQAKLRRIATSVAKEVRQFWSNVEKVVQFKQQSRLDEKRKKALDLQLDFIVGQTEKYSDLLSQSLSEAVPVSKTSSSCVGSSLGGSLRTSPAPSICQRGVEGDGEFIPHEADCEEEDDEETIEIEEQQEGNDAEAHRLELELLKQESELPLDELLQNLPPEILQDDSPMQDTVSSDEDTEEEDEEAEEKVEEEDDEFTANEDEAEDEEDTIAAEEEMAGQQDHTAELSQLAREGEMSLDELLLKYSVWSSEHKSTSVSEHDSVENAEDYESSDCDSSGCESEGVEFLIKQDEGDPSSDRAQHDPPEPKEEITDIAATAESLQPKGYTLATTQVKTSVPFLLRGELREYQHIGLEWMVTMYEKKLNGILADEMGLGKTIQTISLLAHLACERGNWGPHLIIVPTSVILNWEMELKRWCPSFKILTYYGSQKERKLKRQGWTKANAFHVCITSYKLVLQDHQAFRRKNWKYLILDEAQNIKNFKSQRWQSLLNFNSQRRLLLTGTPLQNSLMELWSLMHFLMPHVFQSHREFKEWFSNPLTGMIEGSQEYNEGLVRRLHKVLRPFLLRRIKVDVEKQMPKKYEHVIYCRLSKRQRFLYDDFMSQAATRETLASGHFMSVINILMQLRKVCNHPNLFDPRPIHSPFITSGICYTVPSLVLRALQRHPLEHIDMSLFDLINMEGRVSRYELDDFLPQYKQSRSLIQEIAESPEPPPRPRPLKMKVNRMLQPVKPDPRPVVVVNNSRPVLHKPQDVPPAPAAPPSLTPSNCTVPAPAVPTPIAPAPVQSCPAVTSVVTPVSNGAGKPVPSQTPQPVCSAPQRLILTPDMQARLPSGEVISLGQLASLSGRPLQNQSVTKPFTLQLQGNKLTLSGAPVRPLGVGQPRPVQGNVLHLVSSGGQHHLLSQPAQLALIQALTQQAAANTQSVPQLVQNNTQGQIGVQTMSLQHTLLNSTNLPAASPGQAPATGVVKIVVRQATREIPTSAQRHPVAPPVRPLLRVVQGPSAEQCAAREGTAEQRVAPVVSTSTLTLTNSPLLMMSNPTLTARMPSPGSAQPGVEESPCTPMSGVALRLLTTSAAMQLTNHHSPPPRFTQSPALPNCAPVPTQNPIISSQVSCLDPAPIKPVLNPDGGALDPQSVQNGNGTAIQVSQAVTAPTADSPLYVNLIPNPPSPTSNIPKMAPATPTYNLSLVPGFLANSSPSTVSSSYPIQRFLTSPVSLLTLSPLPTSNSGPSPVLYTHPNASAFPAASVSASLPLLAAPVSFTAPLPVSTASLTSSAPLSVVETPSQHPRSLVSTQSPIMSGPVNLSTASPLPLVSAPSSSPLSVPTTLLAATASILEPKPLILPSDSAPVPLLEASASDSLQSLVLNTALKLPSVASSPMPLLSAPVPFLASGKVPIPIVSAASAPACSRMLSVSQASPLLASAGSSCDPVSSHSILIPAPIALASFRHSAPVTSLTFTTSGSVSSVASSPLSSTSIPAVVTKINAVPSLPADVQAPLPADAQAILPPVAADAQVGLVPPLEAADVSSVQSLMSGLSQTALPCLSLRIPAPQPSLPVSTQSPSMPASAPAPMPPMPASTPIPLPLLPASTPSPVSSLPASALDPASLLLVPAPNPDLSSSIIPPADSTSHPLVISFPAPLTLTASSAHSHIPLVTAPVLPPQSSAAALHPNGSPKPVPLVPHPSAEISVPPSTTVVTTDIKPPTLPSPVSSLLPACAQEPSLSLSVADPPSHSVPLGSTAESDSTEGEELRSSHNASSTCVRPRRPLPPLPRSPFYLEPLEERRRKQKLERLDRIYHLNERRSSLAPVYGTEVLRFCTVQPAIQQGGVLRRCMFTAAERLEQLAPIIERFIFAMPPVEAPLITLHTSHPPPSLVLEETVFKDRLSQELTPHTRCLHRIISNMRTQFPDLRLIQYDCGKLQTLDRLLRQLKSGGHRVLLFTQMTRMLDILEQFLNYHGHIYLRLDGSTRVEQRQVLMERFNMDKRIFCFILSTRSGGVGVNLTGADTVIFYDSDWNPTMDAQAQDRCHRIGQTRDVHIYRLVSERTVEENILKKAQQKRMLGDMAIEGGNFTTAYFKQHTIRELFDMEDASRKEAEVRNVSPDPSTEDVGASRQAHILEQALCGAEDEEDTLAASLVRAEQVADLAEFNENVPLEPEEEEQSRAEQEISALVEQLTPIERYAMYYLEASLEEVSKEELKQAEEQVEAARKDLFLTKDEVGPMTEEKWDEESRRSRKVKTPVPGRPSERVGVRMSERLRGSKPTESLDHTENLTIPDTAPPSQEEEAVSGSSPCTRSNPTTPRPDAASPSTETMASQVPTVDPLSTTLPPSGPSEKGSVSGIGLETEYVHITATQNVADAGTVPGSPVDASLGSPVDAVPVSPEDGVPGSSEDALPGSSEDALPGSPEDALPGSPEDALPGSPEDALPGSPEEALPGSPEEALPDSPEEALPDSPEEALPGSPEEALPGSPEEALPGSPEDALLGRPEDALPDSPEDAVPGSAEDSYPDSPEDAVPDSPVDALPGTPEDALPGTPEDALPGTPEDALPGTPEDALPGTPEDALPGTPEDALPGTPEDALPGTPEDALPGTPEDALPGTPEDALPGTPEDALPGTPEDALPGTPEDALPGTPEDALPGTPEDALPGTPEEALPGTPEEALAGSPEEALAGSPEEALAGSPEEALAGSPEEALAGSPEEALAGSPEEALAGSPEEAMAGSPAEAMAGSPAEALAGSPADAVPGSQLSEEPTLPRTPRRKVFADSEITLAGATEASPTAKVLRRLPGRLVTVVQDRLPPPRRHSRGRGQQTVTEIDCQSPNRPGPPSPPHDYLSEETSETGSPPPKRKRGRPPKTRTEMSPISVPMDLHPKTRAYMSPTSVPMDMHPKTRAYMSPTSVPMDMPPKTRADMSPTSVTMDKPPKSGADMSPTSVTMDKPPKTRADMSPTSVTMDKPPKTRADMSPTSVSMDKPPKTRADILPTSVTMDKPPKTRADMSPTSVSMDKPPKTRADTLPTSVTMDKPPKTRADMSPTSASMDKPPKTRAAMSPTSVTKDKPPKTRAAMSPTSVSMDKPPKTRADILPTSVTMDKPPKTRANMSPTTASMDKPPKTRAAMSPTSVTMDKPPKTRAAMSPTSVSMDKPPKTRADILPTSVTMDKPPKTRAAMSPTSVSMDKSPVVTSLHISPDSGTVSQGATVDLAAAPAVVVQTPGSPPRSFKVNSDSESGSPIEKRKRGRPPKRREVSPIVATSMSPKTLVAPPSVALPTSPKAREEPSFATSPSSYKKCDKPVDVASPMSHRIRTPETPVRERKPADVSSVSDSAHSDSSLPLSGLPADSIIPSVSSNIPVVSAEATSSSGLEEPMSPPKRKRGRPPKPRPVIQVDSSPNDKIDSSPERSPSPQVTRTSLQRKCKPLKAEPQDTREQSSSLADIDDSSDEEVTVRTPLTRSGRTRLQTTNPVSPAVLPSSTVSSKSPRGRSPRAAPVQENLPTKKRKPDRASSPSPSSSPHGSSSEGRKRPCPPTERILRSSLTANPASNTRSSRSPLLNSPNSHRGRKAKT